MVFDEVHSDLESAGYEVQAVVIPAAAVNAPHGRDRVWFVATNTQFKSEGSDRGTNDETERNIRRGNEGDVLGTFCSDGITTNTKECGCRGRVCERCADGERKLFSDEQRRSEMGSKTEGHSGIGDVANTDSIRLQHTEEARNIQEGTRTTQSQGCEFTESVETNGGDGYVTDTSSGGIQGYGGRGKNGEFQTNEFNENNSKRQPRMDWEKFPTQSPICGGDDGLPTELDGITFSKWRNESIKAYGNAIVPQVAYEIFKAIKMTNGN
jgi:DNA (cytosine-5)-methyltransferase 1